jgi:hypothetical protein
MAVSAFTHKEQQCQLPRDLDGDNRQVMQLSVQLAQSQAPGLFHDDGSVGS